jgi:hypothetical protein
MLKSLLTFLMVSLSLNLSATCVVCEKKLQGQEISSAEKLASDGEKIAKSIKAQDKGFWGEFYIKQICGSLYAPPPIGKTFPLNFTHKKAENPVSLKIGADGIGKVEATKVCRAEVPEQLEFNYNVDGKGKASLYSLATAIFSIAQYGKKLIDDHCEKGSRVKGDVNVLPARKFFGGKLDTLTKNVGFYHSKVDPHLADNACSKLYASQFVNFGDKLSCIGYKDREMDEIHIFTVNPPEPYLTRMILRQKHNFNEAGVPSCPVPLKD